MSYKANTYTFVESTYEVCTLVLSQKARVVSRAP